MAAVNSTMLPLGTPAPPFALPDAVSGRTVSLADSKDSRALLVMFICNHCPFVKHIQPELARLGKDYQDKGVAAVAINSNDIAKYPDDRIRVQGHTDSTGTAAHNEELSLRRAQAVREVLLTRGVRQEQMIVEGVGEARPIADGLQRAAQGRTGHGCHPHCRDGADGPLTPQQGRPNPAPLPPRQTIPRARASVPEHRLQHQMAPEQRAGVLQELTRIPRSVKSAS